MEGININELEGPTKNELASLFINANKRMGYKCSAYEAKFDKIDNDLRRDEYRMILNQMKGLRDATEQVYSLFIVHSISSFRFDYGRNASKFNMRLKLADVFLYPEGREKSINAALKTILALYLREFDILDEFLSEFYYG